MESESKSLDVARLWEETQVELWNGKNWVWTVALLGSTVTIPHPAPPGEHPGIPGMEGSGVCPSQLDMGGMPLQGNVSETSLQWKRSTAHYGLD